MLQPLNFGEHGLCNPITHFADLRLSSGIFKYLNPNTAIYRLLCPSHFISRVRAQGPGIEVKHWIKSDRTYRILLIMKSENNLSCRFGGEQPWTSEIVFGSNQMSQGPDRCELPGIGVWTLGVYAECWIPFYCGSSITHLHLHVYVYYIILHYIILYLY